MKLHHLFVFCSISFVVLGLILISNNKDYIDFGKILFMKFQDVLLSELLQLQHPSESYCIGV